MKKSVAIFLLFIILLCGCANQNDDKNSLDANEFYKKFLNNDISATAENGDVYISEFTRLLDGKSGIDRYTFYNNANYDVPLLHIEALEHSVFYFDGEKVVLLYSTPVTRTEGKTDILKDGTVYSTHQSLGATQYYFAKILGDTNIEITSFYAPDSMDEDGIYYFNGDKISKEEFETKTKPFFELTKSGADVEWIPWENSQQNKENSSSTSKEQTLDTEVCSYLVHPSLSKYEIKVEYTQGKKADYLSLYKENDDKEIQRINLSENERFTKKAVYISDITFDGYSDVLVPHQRTASSIYFMAFIWDTATNKLVYAPTFETFGNISLDTDNKLLLSKTSGDKSTTYKIGIFDENSKDFKESEVFNYYVNGEFIFYKEQKSENGIMKTVAEYKFPYNENSDDPYALYPTISDKYTENSHWDLNSSKWENYLISPSDLS